MEFRGIKILYEDKNLLVCFKPAGLSVQTANLRDADMESLLKSTLRERDPGGGEPYLGVVHRLDQPVQGLVVFARTKEAAAKLGAQAADGRMEKVYVALTEADGQSGTGSEQGSGQPVLLEDYLLRDGRNNTSRVVPAGTRGAKKAALVYEDISSQEEFSAGVRLLRIHLQTGRHHQIRVQLSHAGMPLIGDRKYGKPERTGLKLCACRLSFVHPATGKTCSWSVEEETLRNWRAEYGEGHK